MYIETTGHGPDLVLIHGWALHGGVFAPLAERLAGDFTLHRVDLPGHGYSRDSPLPLTLAACTEAIAAQVPDDALWLGWSLGGLFALQAALTVPRVRGVALVASSPRFVEGDGWPHGVAAPVFAQFGEDLRRDYRGTLERFLALDTIGATQGRTELRQLREMLAARGEPAPHVLRDGLALLEHSDLRARLPALPTPSLWLSGHRDRLVSPAAMQAAAALAPRSRYVDIAGGGHAPFLGHAEQVAAELRRFAAALPPRVA